MQHIMFFSHHEVFAAKLEGQAETLHHHLSLMEAAPNNNPPEVFFPQETESLSFYINQSPLCCQAMLRMAEVGLELVLDLLPGTSPQDMPEEVTRVVREVFLQALSYWAVQALLYRAVTGASADPLPGKVYVS